MGRLHPGDDGKHRNAGFAVVALELHRQRPEVRRRPDEYDGEQHQRRDLDPAGHRRPPDEDGHRAGRAADHDVLRRRAFEAHRVDEYVEQDRRNREQRREQVHRAGEEQERHHAEHDPEFEREVRRHPMRGERPLARASHPLVDVAVVVAVDRVCAPCGHRPAEQRAQHQPPGGNAARGDHHRRHGRDEQQDDDARLGELKIDGGTFARAPPRPFGALPYRLAPGGEALRGRFRKVAADESQRRSRPPGERAERYVRDHRRLRQARPDVRGADQDLRGEQSAEGGRHRAHGALRRLAAPRAPHHGRDQDPGAEGEEPVQEVRGRVLAEVGDEPAVHQRPVGKRQTRVLSPHVRADQKQHERHDGGPRREARERPPHDRVFLPFAGPLEAETRHGAVQKGREENHRDGEMDRHGDRRQALAHHDRSEQRLRDHEDQRRDGRPHDPGHVTVSAPRGDQQDADEDHDERGEESVRELDRDVPVLDPGDEPAVAVRPVVAAAQPGLRRADEPADRDQSERGRRGDDREFLEAIHKSRRARPTAAFGAGE